VQEVVVWVFFPVLLRPSPILLTCVNPDPVSMLASSAGGPEEDGWPWKTSSGSVTGPQLGQGLKCLEVSRLVTVRSRTGATTAGLEIQEPLLEQGFEDPVLQMGYLHE